MKTIALIAMLAVFASRAFSADSPASAARPNVLFIAVDDLRDWVGYHGQNRQTITPNFDRLAARGMAFTRAYCAAPACNPSRAALMSGLRPSTTGVYNNDNDWRPHISPDLTLVTTMQRAGYETLAAGKIYHGGFDRKSEWNNYAQKEKKDPLPTGNDRGVGKLKFSPLDCSDDAMQDAGIANYGVEQLSRRHDQPFFLCVGFHKPHIPWTVPQKYYDLHPLDKIELPPILAGDLDDVPAEGAAMSHQNQDHENILKSGRWKEAVRAYLATISFVDAMLGRVIDALDRSQVKDNTIVILWSDHGWSLGEKEHWRKFALWEEPTRSPFIVIAPGLTQPGTYCDRPIDFMTIYPTVTDLCGIPTPAHVEGKSLRPLLANRAAKWVEPAVMTWEFNNHAVRADGWRYIHYAGGGEELYDETADPNEWHNLAADPSYAAKKSELAKWLPTKNAPEVTRAGTPDSDGDSNVKTKIPKK